MSPPRQPLSARARGAICLTLLWVGGASPLGAQECPHGRISHVFVDNHSIFDAETLPEDGRFRWAYELANRIHVRTREEFILGEILLDEGDCFDPGLAQESARVLRDFRFIADADVFEVPQPDGTRHLVVDTRDEWTTKVTAAPGYDDGVTLEGAAITEENFLGRGMLISLFYRERRIQRDAGVLVEAPRLFSLPWDGLVQVVRTRVGTSVEQLVIRPFVAEEPQVAVRQRVRRNDRLFTFHGGRARDYDRVAVAAVQDLAELTVAARFGRPGDLLLVGGGLSWEALRFHGEEGDPQVIPDGRRYADREPAPPDVRAALAPQLVERETGRLNLMAGVRRLHFQGWRGLDAIRGVQDVPLGTEASIVVGRSVGFLPRSPLPEARDLLVRAELFWGRPMGPVLAHGLVRGEGRRLAGDDPGPAPWRDLLLEGTGLVYWQPDPAGNHVFVARATASGGWHSTGPFQITLGGEDGVRGFRDRSFPGARTAVLSLEDRIRFDSPLRDLADVGLTLFADGGFVAPGDAPFGARSGVHASVGAGLRLGFPAGTSSVIRFDVALPVTGEDAFRAPVLLVSSREILGLLAPLGNRQLGRSRRSGVGTDFIGVAVDPYRW